jgi:hypothetical protein
MSPSLRHPALAALLLGALLAWWAAGAPAGSQIRPRERPRPTEPPAGALDQSPPPAAGGAIQFGARWEYRVVGYRAGQTERELERELNELGEQGWELAAALSRPAGPPREREAGRERERDPEAGRTPGAGYASAALVLKRPRSGVPRGGPEEGPPRLRERFERPRPPRRRRRRLPRASSTSAHRPTPGRAMHVAGRFRPLLSPVAHPDSARRGAPLPGAGRDAGRRRVKGPGRSAGTGEGVLVKC